MRIGLVAPFGLRVRGTTRARALPLARALTGRGHDVGLFIPPYDSPVDAGRRWQDEGVEVVHVALPAPGRGSAAWHLWLAWRLLAAVRQWRPEIVHVFKPKGPSGLVGALLWVTRRRGDGAMWRAAEETHRVTASRRHRVIVDTDDWEGAGGWNDDPRAGYSSLQRRFFAWQERYGLSHADAWTVTSECLRRRAIGSGADPARVFLMHNGVPASQVRLRASSHGLPVPGRSAPAILYTRFAGVRPADVAAIWGRVRESLPAATLTVLGRGTGGEEAALVGLPGVEVMGWVEPDALPDHLARGSVALVPWADTPANRARHSVKVLELMAAGLPIVAWAVGELPATLEDAGVLVPAGDPERFAQEVAALLADLDRSRQLGEAARARVAAQFTWDRLADTALEAYRAASMV